MLEFLQSTHQLIIPIYQRTYSWEKKQCEQLWNDIIRVANRNGKTHFIGSILYIKEGHYMEADVHQLLVIDGQQRLTTLLLLLAALRDALEGDSHNEVTQQKIDGYYFFNEKESGEKRHKLILTQSDKDTLINLLEQSDYPESYSSNIMDNFTYFQDRIAKGEIDLNLLYRGIRKLTTVHISLDSNYDDPQLIFESLNSKGLILSQADLIRNYILMGLNPNEQEELYKKYWHPIEKRFQENKKAFDRFMRDYLTIKTGNIPNIEAVYDNFKIYHEEKCHDKESVAKLVSNIFYFSNFFIKLFNEAETDSKLKRIICDINTLRAYVSYPFLLKIYEDFDKKKISKEEILEIFSLVESYIFRRAACNIPTNALNKIFAQLVREIDKKRYLESIKKTLSQSQYRFPKDQYFEDEFIKKHFYGTRVCGYLLDKLENHNRKERVSVKDYTIEHIMPQNKNLSQEWRNDLGETWSEIHEIYLDTVGNLTLTGYNTEMSDKPYLEKRDMVGGFADSPIRLNARLAKLKYWNKDEITKRANDLSNKAVKIWKYPHTH